MKKALESIHHRLHAALSYNEIPRRIIEEALVNCSTALGIETVSSDDLDGTEGSSTDWGAILAAIPPMTPEQAEAQRCSFAYGNVAIDNPNVTREMVDASSAANQSPAGDALEPGR